MYFMYKKKIFLHLAIAFSSVKYEVKPTN
jgi:hypothetical protein